ncbi:hypothetical protein LEMLEM_LOCUS6468 [Lemmus lemmus]
MELTVMCVNTLNNYQKVSFQKIYYYVVFRKFPEVSAVT